MSGIRPAKSPESSASNPRDIIMRWLQKWFEVNPDDIETHESLGPHKLVSNNYIRSSIVNGARDCISLKSLPQGTLEQIAECQIVRAKAHRTMILGVLVLWITGCGVLIAAQASRSRYSPGFVDLVDSITASVITGIMLWIIWSFPRRYYMERAIIRIYDTLIYLEQSEKYTFRAFRNSVIRRLNNIATAIERIPLQYNTLSKTVRAQAFSKGESRAQAVRELQHSVISPGPQAFNDLTSQLLADLQILLAGNWYELPEVACEKRRPLIRILLQIVAAVAMLLAVVMIARYHSRFGIFAPVASSVLSITAIILINNAGLPVNMVQSSAEVASKIRP
jgi:hypothetical protein